MIDPSMTHLYQPTPTVEELQTKIVSLESDNKRLADNYDYARQRHSENQSMIDQFEVRLKTAIEDQEIDSDLAKEFADIFSIPLERSYDVTVTVTFSGTVSVPLDFDIDDLENHLSASLEASHYSSDVSVDLMEDGMEIDAQWSY